MFDNMTFEQFWIDSIPVELTSPEMILVGTGIRLLLDVPILSHEELDARLRPDV